MSVPPQQDEVVVGGLPKPSLEPLGTITDSATLDATAASDYTGDFTDDWDLTLAGFTDENQDMWFGFTVSGGTAPIVSLFGYTITWPVNQTANLTDLADGYHEVVFKWNGTTNKVTPWMDQVT